MIISLKGDVQRLEGIFDQIKHIKNMKKCNISQPVDELMESADVNILDQCDTDEGSDDEARNIIEGIEIMERREGTNGNIISLDDKTCSSSDDLSSKIGFGNSQCSQKPKVITRNFISVR